jgi:flagellar motility protein MotE (MotC chaperone)
MPSTLLSRLRLLPILMMAATALLGFKVADLIAGGGSMMAPDAHAQAASAPSASKPSAATPAATPEAKPALETAAPKPSPATTAAKPPGEGATVDPQSLSPAEIGVLQQLSQRRKAIDQRAAELDQREIVLQAAEKRIDQKIAELQALQKSIAVDVQKRAAAEDARIQMLVKIYEAMKPEDAAQIFDQLDMPVLLSVLKRMKERKTAPILAAMAPEKAKAITTALAESQDPNAAPHGAPPSPKL